MFNIKIIIVISIFNIIRFINKDDNYINLDSDKGVYVTSKFASINGFDLGDKITWHIYGDDTYYTSEIVGFNKDPQNQNMTMTRSYLESLGINYKPDTIYSNDDSSKNISTTLVSSVQDVESLKSSMNDMLSMMKTMLTNWLFKVAIAEHYDFNAYIGIVSYVCAAIGTFVISYIVSKMLAKKISKIDMVTSLKGNE